MKGLALLALVLATGCGEVVKNNNDADGDTDGDTDGDADGDIVEPDAPPGPVTTRFRALSFNGDGLPDLTSRFVVTDSSGAVIGMGPTDIEGYYSVDLTDEVTVSLVRRGTDNAEELRYTVETLLGVKPGDDIVFGVRGLPSTTVTATMEAFAANIDAFPQRTLTTPCFNRTTNVDGYLKLEFTDTCHGSTFELFGTASGGPTADRYFYEAAQPFETGTSFVTPAFDLTVRPFTMSLANLPSDLNTASVQRSTLVGTQRAYSSQFNERAPTGTTDYALTYPPVNGLRWETNVALYPEVGLMYYFDDARHTLGGALHVVDFNENRLPVIDTVAIDATGVQWTESANPGAGDAAGVILYYSWFDDAQRQIEIEWRVVGPTLTSPFALPTLPASLEVPDPAAATGVLETYGGVIGIEVDRIAGYDELRPNFDAFLVSIDALEGLYPGETFVMRRTQAVANNNTRIARKRGGLLLPWSAAGRGGAHAGQ